MQCDTDYLLNLLPDELRKTELGPGGKTFNLREVCLDMGKKPFAYFFYRKGHVFIHEDDNYVVTNFFASHILFSRN